jgi:hypothetical protein
VYTRSGKLRRLAPRAGPAQLDFRALGDPVGGGSAYYASVYVCVLCVYLSYIRKPHLSVHRSIFRRVAEYLLRVRVCVVCVLILYTEAALKCT